MVRKSSGKSESILELKGITKEFPGGIIANDHIDWELREGEVHALLGENGAGKTTLMNIIFGLYEPDEGEIYVRGEKVKINSPIDAIDLGLGMVHQQFRLSPKMKVYENVILGKEPSSRGFIDMEKSVEEISKISKKYSLKINPKAKIGELSAGEKQKTELLKALYQEANILILDEPTATLTPEEKEEFLNLIRQMADEGKAIIPFITHKLPEVFKITDRVTILKEGKVVDTIDIENATRENLAEKMVGRKSVFQVKKVSREPGSEVLRMNEVSAPGRKEASSLKSVSLEVREGEIVGIAGVSGNGQRELTEVLRGLRNPSGGKIFLKGEEITNLSPEKIIEKNFGYIPENAGREGVVLDYTVAENLFLRLYSDPTYLKSGFVPGNKKWLIDEDRIESESKRLMEEFNIKAPSPETKARHLSGGNLQRLLLARELFRSPSFLLADKPTKGLDVGSQEFIRNKLLDEKMNGRGILLISENLDELLMICDRIAGMYEGQIPATLPIQEADKEKLGLMMTSGKKPAG